MLEIIYLKIRKDGECYVAKEAIEKLLTCPIGLSEFEALEFSIVSADGSASEDYSPIYKSLYNLFQANEGTCHIYMGANAEFNALHGSERNWIRVRGPDVIDLVQEAGMSDIQKLSNRYNRFFSKMKEFFPDLDFESRLEALLGSIKHAASGGE